MKFWATINVWAEIKIIHETLPHGIRNTFFCLRYGLHSFCSTDYIIRDSWCIKYSLECLPWWACTNSARIITFDWMLLFCVFQWTDEKAMIYIHVYCISVQRGEVNHTIDKLNIFMYLYVLNIYDMYIYIIIRSFTIIIIYSSWMFRIEQ